MCSFSIAVANYYKTCSNTEAIHVECVSHFSINFRTHKVVAAIAVPAIVVVLAISTQVA